MSYRQIKFKVPEKSRLNIEDLIERNPVLSYEASPLPSGKLAYEVFVRTIHTQDFTDSLQSLVSDVEIFVFSLESIIPQPAVVTEANKFMGISREELYDDITKGAVIDNTFILMVVLSTVVAAIGLLRDNVAVVIGAMVIAPLLGPNLALTFATSLGDVELLKMTVRTIVVGFGITLLISVFVGLFWSSGLEAEELVSRSEVGFDSMALALASGTAAVLSITSGLSTALVGVMVAVALLPPATAAGIFLGAGHYAEASGATLLLAVNIVCLNLSAQTVFLLRGISPRTWWEKKQARTAVLWQVSLWTAAFTLLLFIISIHSHLR